MADVPTQAPTLGCPFGAGSVCDYQCFPGKVARQRVVGYWDRRLLTAVAKRFRLGVRLAAGDGEYFCGDVAGQDGRRFTRGSVSTGSPNSTLARGVIIGVDRFRRRPDG
jgi:hypothetical protein